MKLIWVLQSWTLVNTPFGQPGAPSAVYQCHARGSRAMICAPKCLHAATDQIWCNSSTNKSDHMCSNVHSLSIPRTPITISDCVTPTPPSPSPSPCALKLRGLSKAPSSSSSSSSSPALRLASIALNIHHTHELLSVHCEAQQQLLLVHRSVCSEVWMDHHLLASNFLLLWIGCGPCAEFHLLGWVQSWFVEGWYISSRVTSLTWASWHELALQNLGTSVNLTSLLPYFTAQLWAGIPISSVLVFGGLRWQPNFLPGTECVFTNYLLLLASLYSFGFFVTVLVTMLEIGHL